MTTDTTSPCFFHVTRTLGLSPLMSEGWMGEEKLEDALHNIATATPTPVRVEIYEGEKEVLLGVWSGQAQMDQAESADRDGRELTEDEVVAYCWTPVAAPATETAPKHAAPVSSVFMPTGSPARIPLFAVIRGIMAAIAAWAKRNDIFWCWDTADTFFQSAIDLARKGGDPAKLVRLLPDSYLRKLTRAAPPTLRVLAEVIVPAIENLNPVEAAFVLGWTRRLVAVEQSTRFKQ